MNKLIKISFTIFIVVIMALMFISVSNANSNNISANPATSSSGSSHIVVYTTYTSPSQYLYVPANSTGVLAFPDWHIYLYGTGNFTMKYNGTVIETGYSATSFNFVYTFPVPGGTYINATIIFQGITYNFTNEEISGPVSNKQIISVTIESTCSNNPQMLSVKSGQSGMLMYPHWIATMQTTQNESYTIYLNGAQIFSGNVYGNKTLSFNVTGATATVLIGIGSHVYKYSNEIIARKALNKYYAPPPPSLVYTLAQYESGIVKAFVASFFAIMIALFTAHKGTLESEKRKVLRV